MDKKGFWALLASVSKAWKTIFTRTNDSFRYRQAAGNYNILLPEKNGRAVIDTIYGNTVKWNQLLPEFDNWTKRSVSNFTIVDNVVSFNTTVAYGGIHKEVVASSGHQYYVAVDIKRTTSSGTGLLSLYQDNAQLKFAQTSNETFTHLSFITTSQSANNLSVLIMGGSVTCGLSAKGQKLTDLTAMFGTDAEIAAALGIDVADITTATGVAAFEAWLALNGGEQDYYPYDEGSLISFRGKGVKSVGFNKWDEVAEVGTYTNGQKYPGNTTIRCANPIKVLPNTTYYNCGTKLWVHFLDANGNYISDETVNAGTTFTTLSNAAYIVFRSGTNYGTTYNHDICINISDQAKNGTYEPYKEEVVDLSGAYINVWDEEWEPGSIAVNNGAKYDAGGGIRSKNFCEITPSKWYYGLMPPEIGGYRLAIVFYDNTKTFITTKYFTSQNPLQAPDNAAYFKILSRTVTTYNNNICINVSNADINGTYYPHALQSVDNYDHSGATQLDIMTNEQLIKKCKTLIFKGDSSENWSYSTGFSIHLEDYFSMPLYGICNKFKNAGNGADGTFAIANNKYAHFYDSTITSLENWKTQLQTWYNQGNPLTLIYPLSTPVTIPINPPINMQYKVNKYSTEEVIFPESADGSPTSTAIVADIEYQSKKKKDYLELEYIESTGTQYIDTGINPTQNYSFDVTFMQSGDGSNTNSLFGCRVNGTYGHCGITGNLELAMDFFANALERSNARLTYTIIPNNIYHCHLENKNRYIKDANEVLLASNLYDSISFSINKTAPLFCIDWDGNLRTPGTWRVYKFVVYLNGAVIQNLIPCKNKNNVVCMYDTVTKQFFYNQGTGDFVAGPVVS